MTCVARTPGRRHPSLYQSCTRLKPRSEIKIAKNIGEITFGGGFCKCWQAYIGMIYMNIVGEMCFIPTNVTTVQWYSSAQMAHLSPVVSTFSKSIRLLSSFFIKRCILPPDFSLFLPICIFLFLWYPIPFS